MSTDRTLIETQRARRGHDFYPAASEWAAVPALYATDGLGFESKMIHLHYFMGACDWWVVEVDHDDGRAFGYACLGDPGGAEWGYVELVELEALTIDRGGMSFVVERDLYWEPVAVRDVVLPGWP